MPILFYKFERYFASARTHIDHVLQDIPPSPCGFFQILFSVIPDVHRRAKRARRAERAKQVCYIVTSVIFCPA